MTDSAIAAPRSRRWLIHVIWLAVALLAFWGGMKFSSQLYNATLGMMIQDNDRNEQLGEIRVDLRLIGDDDVAVHRRIEAMRLRTSVIKLSVMPRYAACRPKDAQGLVAAKAYLDAHPIESEQKYGEAHSGLSHDELYAEGLAYCDKPITPYPYPYIIF
jgi:hypothetical protein